MFSEQCIGFAKISIGDLKFRFKKHASEFQ